MNKEPHIVFKTSGGYYGLPLKSVVTRRASALCNIDDTTTFCEEFKFGMQDLDAAIDYFSNNLKVTDFPEEAYKFVKGLDKSVHELIADSLDDSRNVFVQLI